MHELKTFSRLYSMSTKTWHQNNACSLGYFKI